MKKEFKISVEERIKEIDELISFYRAVIVEKDKKWNYSKPFDEYWEFISIETDKIAELSREKRFIMPYELKEIPDYADVMSLKDFIKCVEDGGFIDYDGHGRYVKDGKETNIMIIPSDVENNSIRKEFDSVAWYNK